MVSRIETKVGIRARLAHPGFRFAPPMGYDPVPLRGSRSLSATARLYVDSIGPKGHFYLAYVDSMGPNSPWQKCARAKKGDCHQFPLLQST